MPTPAELCPAPPELNRPPEYLKPVATLCADSREFWIPKYQRGYRWKKTEVTRLLNDLKEFLDEDTVGSMRPFYCLQPLVVKKTSITVNGQEKLVLEVVDGQQRLTTLFLIFKYLTESTPFGLSYETRERSKDYLQTLDVNLKGKYIDFYHIYNAHAAVVKWFDDETDEKARTETKASLSKLLANSDPRGRNVRFIWYELPDGDDAVDVFTRLNNDKIPLTDEELIRALFLRNPGGGDLAEGAFQHRLAIEWDRIETTFQAADFWAFLSKEPGAESGRIRLLFELCAPEEIFKKKSQEKPKNEHWLFLHYESELAKATPDQLRHAWRRIVTVFERLEEWWRDPELFHLVGFLSTIATNDSVSRLRSLLEKSARTASTKTAFKAHLREKIRKYLIRGETVTQLIDSIDYETNRGRIEPTLVLFNIATLLRVNGMNLRFPFHRYHNDHSWDIEHVGSQAGDNLTKPTDQIEWLELCKSELELEPSEDVKDSKNPSGDLLSQIAKFKDGAIDARPFETLHNQVLEYFGEADESVAPHGIGNLTLLDSSTNRAYKNAPFAVKRSTVLAKEKEGTFILPCTRDLFLKCYSKKPGNLRRWNPEDGEAHKSAICQTLEQFFQGKGSNHE